MVRIRPLLLGWLRDEHGSVTIEFVLWTPFLCTWLVISAVLFDAYKSRYDAAKAAHTLSDIISREVEVDDAFFLDLYELQERLLPRAPAGARLRVTSIQYLAEDEEEDERYRVLWSEGLGGADPMVDETIPLRIMPEMANFDTVILTELHIPYRPFSDWAGIEVDTWSYRLVARPRFIAAIARVE